MSEGLVIPVSVDNTKAKEGIAEVSEAFETLGKEAKKAGTSGAQATNAMAAGAQKAAASTNTLASRYAALKGWIEGTQKSQGLLGRAGQATAGSLNAFFASLTSEVGELTRGTDGTTQSLVNLGAQALPSLGPVGAALAALAGGVGLITRMEREQSEALRTSITLYDIQARMAGQAAANISAGIAANATDEERLRAFRAGEAERQEMRANLITEGYRANAAAAAAGILPLQGLAEANAQVVTRSRQYMAGLEAALPAIQAHNGGVNQSLTLAQLHAAVASQNTGLLREWGIEIRFGTDQVVNQARALEALNQVRVRDIRARIEAAQRTVAGARAEEEVTRRQTAHWLGGHYAREELAERQRASRDAVTRATNTLAAAERELQAVQGAGVRLAADVVAAEQEVVRAREATKAFDALEASKNRTQARMEAAAASAASMMEMRAANQALLDAQYALSVASSRAREELNRARAAATSPEARAALDQQERERAIFHLRQQIAFATEEYNISRQRGENAAQFATRRAAALQRVATLEGEMAAARRAAAEEERAEQQRLVDLGAQLQTGAREAALRSITEAQEGLNRSTARYTAEQAGSYQTRDAQLAQLDREVAVRATLIGRLQEQRRAAAEIEDLQARAQALAAISSQQNGLEAQQQAAQAQRRQLTMGQLQQMENAVKRLADTSVNASGTAGQAFDALTSAMGSSAAAYFKGEKTFEEASQAMVHSTLSAVSEIASKEMIMQLAAGTAALFVNPPAAGAHFAAAGLYGLVAAGAGAASAATKPSEASAGGGGSEARRPTSSDDTASAAAMGQVTVTNYYAPVIEGRAATQDQVGMRLNRYQRAGAMRLERHS